jgi:hypothetical protein
VGAGGPADAGSGRTRHVVALSSGLRPDWRWRIINHEGGMVTQRLNEMDVVNRAEVARTFR